MLDPGKRDQHPGELCPGDWSRKNPKTGRKKRVQIWPRYHQLDVVRQLLGRRAKSAALAERYLIQHSPGSGKSFSIAWLAHQMIPLEKDGNFIFDSIIVVTDRRILDRQIRDTIRQVRPGKFHRRDTLSVRAICAGSSTQGKKIIISTIQKFPVHP